MAVARLSVGIGKKGKAAPHALYIAREEKYAKHDDDLEKLEFKGHGNMPKWAQDRPNFFWKMSDEHERKNGTTYREHVISLPRELTPLQRHRLVTDWIEQEINDKHAYQYAIHNPPAMDGDEQPHVHLMFSERLRDGIEREPDVYFKRHNAKNPERGGAKKANTPKLSADRKAELVAQRDRWEQLCNKHLELAGSDARISMKSLKEQGIEREPINFTMKQIKQKKYEFAYIDALDARFIAEAATADVTKHIDVSLELKRLDSLKLADSIFGNSAMSRVPRPRPSATDQHQKDDAEPLPPTPTLKTRIERLKEDPSFFAYAITHFKEFTEEDKDKNDGFYFDSQQQQELDTLTDALYRNRSVNNHRTGDWQEDIKQGVAWLIRYNSAYIETNKDLSKALDIALDPIEHRRKAKENAPEIEQETVKTDKNEVAQETQTNRTSMRMRK